MQEENSLNFLEEIIEKDLQDKKYTKILTRFPPEPNGHLHLGHAKSICLNFGLAKKYKGATHLRFDDTNPDTEESSYVESIKEDIKWLGFEWDAEFFASDYFEIFYGYARQLIEKGLAYVDESPSEMIASEKGTPTTPGIRNQYANHSVTENLKLFEAMRAGAYPDGAMVLRAKIDMGSPNMLLRDPIIYRIKKANHHRTGDQWAIYPMYDFAHGQSDSIEGITHSICTLEFMSHKPLYNWFIEKLNIFPSHQYEFARLNLTYTVMSKRKLLQLVQEKYVEGWDDPRMPTISGMRRRGYGAEAIRNFCEKIGIARRENLIDIGLLEFCVREELNKKALRRMVVFDPLKIVITNFEKETEWIKSENNPENSAQGFRDLPFTKEIYIEREDFMEDPPKKFFRLSVGQKVRLKSAYIIQCDSVEKDEMGTIKTLYCSYFPESKSGADISGIAVKTTIHWVSKPYAVPIELKLYDRLFTEADLSIVVGDFTQYISAKSLTIISTAWGEPSLKEATNEQYFQFLRKGYFVKDNKTETGKLVFNRTVTLKDNWAKEVKKANW